eukprot:s223_g18.t1
MHLAAARIAHGFPRSSAEEASYTAAAARDAAVNSATDVTEVAKAALEAAKAANATATEQVAAAAVAASDVAKKQGANAEQAAEVAAAAAKAAGASPQEQSAAATMAYSRAGGNETLNASSLGLPPVVGRPNVSEEEAEEIAAKENESLDGSEILEVSDPDAFIHDASALEAVRDALAEELGVDPDAIVIESAATTETSATVPALLEMHRKTSIARRQARQAPASGEVNITYKVVPSVSSKTSDEVIEAIQKLDSDSASKLHEKVFEEKQLPYQVQVANLEVVVTDKEKGQAKGEGALKPKSIRSCSQLTSKTEAAWAGRMEAAVERPTAKQPLWLKVDRAVQRAARVESARMRCALECSDPDQMQAMMTWWMARDPSAASSGGTATARLLQEDSCSAEEAGEGETLGTLLFSERLHRRFPYVSFYGPDDYAVGGSVSEADGGLEFERLQQALQQNLQALQDLRSRLAPYQESSRSSLFWKWSDVVAVATRFREALGFPAKAAKAAASGTFGLGRGMEEVDLSDSLAEFTTIFGLFLAALVGIIGSGGAALGHQWGWAAGLLAFACANSVLLQNYSRLHLPHVRRRLEQRLKELSQQKDALLKDVQQVQRASRKTGIVQLRAHIFLQSVNVIRNMDYLTRCIKTEVQRMSSEKARKTQLQKRLVASGLQLLLALLPHSSPQWQEEALGGEQCAELASVIFSRRAVQSNQASQLISSSYADSRKRLWLLFRMVHLSSAIPTEVQGKLSALMDSYLRPVLVERRLPTGYCQAAMLEDGLQQGTRSARRDEERPKSPTARGRSASGSASVDEEAESEDHFSFAASTASKVSNSSASKVTSDTSKTLRRLFATRGDLLQVLKRLPQQALQSQGGCSTQAESLLRGICTSVVVGVPQELVPNSQAASHAPALAAWYLAKSAESHFPHLLPFVVDANQVGLGIGYRYGRSYSLSFAQITLELTVVVPTSAGPKELSVQFSQLSDVEPSSAHASNAWSELTAALPLRFNDAALRVRRRNLKKAKETLRSLR